MYSSDMNDSKGNKNNKTVDIITILLVGGTGGGKSTLANVISGSDDFDVGHRSVSSTKDTIVHNYAIDGNVYKIVDTVGIGDTKTSSKEIINKLVMAAEAIKYGINQILFVTNGRFTDLEIECFEILQSAAFDKNIFEYTTIVRTNFSDFEDDAKCEKDYQDMASGNDDISEFVKSCKKVIHVNNPPISRRIRQGIEETQEESRKRLRNYLNACTKIYVPEKLQEIVNEKLKGFMTHKEQLQNEINDLKQKLKEANEQRQRQEQDQRRAADVQRELEERIKKLEERKCIIL